MARMLAQEDLLCLLLHNLQVQPLWQELFKKVHADQTHVGGLWSQGDGPQKDKLRFLLHQFQNKLHLDGAHGKQRLSAVTWTSRC